MHSLFQYNRKSFYLGSGSHRLLLLSSPHSKQLGSILGLLPVFYYCIKHADYVF